MSLVDLRKAGQRGLTLRAGSALTCFSIFPCPNVGCGEEQHIQRDAFKNLPSCDSHSSSCWVYSFFQEHAQQQDTSATYSGSRSLSPNFQYHKQVRSQLSQWPLLSWQAGSLSRLAFACWRGKSAFPSEMCSSCQWVWRCLLSLQNVLPCFLHLPCCVLRFLAVILNTSYTWVGCIFLCSFTLKIPLFSQT